MKRKMIAALLCASMAVPATGGVNPVVNAAEETTVNQTETTITENSAVPGVSAAPDVTTGSSITEDGTNQNITPENGAEEKITSGAYGTNLNWKFNEESGVLEINGSGEMEDIETPWGMWNDNVKEVVIGSSVTSIADNIFTYLSNLEKVTIGKKVKTLSSKVFYDCENLSTIKIEKGNKYYCVSNNVLYNAKKTKILFLGNGKNHTCTIPASVKKININNTSNKLEKIVVNKKNKVYSATGGVLCNKAGTELLRCPNGKKGSYEVPSKVKTIGKSAFASCKKLTEVKVEKNVTLIQEYAFKDCTGLKKVKLGSKVLIEEIEMTDGDWWGWKFAEVFSGCISLEEVNVSSKNKKYNSQDGVVFHRTTLVYYPQGRKETSYVISDKVKEIRPGAFTQCANLEELDFGEGVDEIVDGLRNCIGIKKLKLGSSYAFDSVGVKYIFEECPNLEEVTISEKNKEICMEDGIVYDKSKKQIVYICKEIVGEYIMPDTITRLAYKSIGKEEPDPIDVFADCSQMTSLKFSNSLGKDGLKLDLSKCYNLKKIELGAETKDFDYVMEEDNIEEFIVPETNENYAGVDGILYDKKENTVYKCGKGKKGKVVIADGTKVVGDNAFYQCKNLEEVVMSNSLNEIGENSFSECRKLKKIVLSENVKEIGVEAFYNCTELSEIIIKSETLEWIAPWAFKNINPNAVIIVPKGKSEEYKKLFDDAEYQTGYTTTMTIKEAE